MRDLHRARHGAHGFSLVELLVTIVLAGIIFAAMVPVFVSALKKSAGDNLRVTANNIAQERIEQVRLAAVSGYVTITTPNLMATPNTVGDCLFGPTYKRAGSNTVYNTNYTVKDGAGYKQVTVTVKWPGAANGTSLNTIVMDPTAAVTSTTSGSPSASPSPGTTTGAYTVTVSFKNWSDVTSSGVKVVRTDVTPNATMAPAKQVPSSSSQTLSWTGVPGGPTIQYIVTCYSQYGTFSTPPFHLLSNCPIYFDTHPGSN